MKRMYLCAAMLLAAACDRSGDYDAAGTFEATEITAAINSSGVSGWIRTLKPG